MISGGGKTDQVLSYPTWAQGLRKQAMYILPLNEMSDGLNFQNCLNHTGTYTAF